MAFYLSSILHLLFLFCPLASVPCLDSFPLIYSLCLEIPPNFFLLSYWPFKPFIKSTRRSPGKYIFTVYKKIVPQQDKVYYMAVLGLHITDPSASQVLIFKVYTTMSSNIVSFYHTSTNFQGI